MINPTLRLHTSDNVILARMDLEPGTHIPEEGLTCQERIPAGHKLATITIHPDEVVRKYGQIIGFATCAIAPGQHVHTHNLAVMDFDRDYAFCADTKPTEFVEKALQATFEGFVRSEGDVGTRNYLGVLSTVNCSASVCHMIADAFQKDALASYPNVDGVIALSHEGGCCVAPSGEGFEILQRTLAGYIRHPNFAGVLLIGLGCEVNQVDSLLANMGLEIGPRLQPRVIQEAGGIQATVREGVALLQEMAQEASRAMRRTVPASHITLALECGGSDAFSGITANPALGIAVDMLINQGGTAILSETPEIYGAEHVLTRRAVSRDIGEKLVSRITWWENYTAQFLQHLDNNPTPGNKAGGLSTILEKSLGAVAKGGTSNLVEVLHYAEAVKEHGLVFMDTPGNDAVSVTGMVAGGANLVCFTTGRGSVFGSKPAPTLKLATNSSMYHHMAEDMDINCGLIADGQSTLQQMGEKIFHTILKTASGKQTQSEIMGMGDHEFVPWRIGPML